MSLWKSYDSTLIKIKQGNVIDVLKKMRSNSVHCIITSPPYWGLRDYGIPPMVWGGDAKCAHRWGSGITACQSGGGWARSDDQTNAKKNFQLGERSQGAFCNCGAWRGAYGLEPTIELYIHNAVEIFREVRRVLRPDGTLWLNLGDSYATSANGRSAADTKAAGKDDRTYRDKPFSTVGGVLK